MGHARETLDWFTEKVKTDALTFLTSVYIVGIFPAMIIGAVNLYWKPLSSWSLVQVTSDALLWPWVLLTL